MRRTRYGGYRGRRTGRNVLRYVILGLLVLIGVLAGILLLGRERPAEEQRPAVEQEQPEEQNPIPEEPVPAPEPEPEPEPEIFVMRAMGVEMAQVLDGSWERVLEEAGANALVLNMKPDDAPLNWVSAEPMAAAAKANSAVEGINTTIRALNAREDLYTVARMSCFRDELLAGTHAYCIRSNSDYRWKDFGRVHWVNIWVTEVQDYMVALAVELAELGFDEILLDNCGYPQNGSGEMGWIRKGEQYDLNNLDGVVGGFLAKLTAALDPYGVVLSVRTNPAVVQDEMGDRTGLNGFVLEQYADRIWISEVDTAAPLAEVLTLAGVSDVGERLVTQTETLVPENDWKQAVLTF